MKSLNSFRNQRWSNFTYKEEINQLDVNITYINILGQGNIYSINDQSAEINVINVSISIRFVFLDKKYYLEHLDKFQSFIAYSCDEQSKLFFFNILYTI